MSQPVVNRHPHAQTVMRSLSQVMFNPKSTRITLCEVWISFIGSASPPDVHRKKSFSGKALLDCADSFGVMAYCSAA